MSVQDACRTPLSVHQAEVQALLAGVAEQIAADPPKIMHLQDPSLLGRVSAESLRARSSLPRFDDSQMDGFAVRAVDLLGAAPESPRALPVGRATAAGDPPLRHVPGTASPVMTGAALPAGADAVVPVERTLDRAFSDLRRAGDPCEPVGEIAFTAPASHGDFVRRAGSDVSIGEELLPAGDRLAPWKLGVLAAAGIDMVPVRRRCRILLCTTGDELAAEGSATLPAGLVCDSSGPMLSAALRGEDAEVRRVRTRDTPEDLIAALAAEREGVDLIITCGGISAGAFEVVREALAPLGARFLSVALQPGGPQGLGLIDLPGSPRPVPVLCFPGNPVSTIISAELLVLPWLRGLAGKRADRPREERALAHAVRSPEDKHQVRRAQILEDGTVRLSDPGSHLLGDLARAEALAHLPVGVAHLEAGRTVEIWRIDD